MKAACVLVLLGLGAMACLRREDGGQSRSQELLEIRDATGTVTFTMRRQADGYAFTDAEGHEGQIVADPGGGLHARDAAGRPLAVVPAPGGYAVGLDLTREGKPHLRLRLDKGQWRLIDASAIPRGRVSITAEGAVAHDPAGILRARVYPGGGRLVVSDRNGAVLGYASASASPVRVALVRTAELDPTERALLLAAPKP